MKTIFQSLLKSLLVGMTYVVALVLGGLVVNGVGLKLPEAKDAIVKLAWSFAGGAIAGLSLGPIAARMPASRIRQFMVWASVIFFNLASVAVEGYFFVPEVIGNTLPGLLIQQFLASLGPAWMVTALFAPKETSATTAAYIRSGISWVWRILASALVYVGSYFIFGAINYVLVTKPYYEIHVSGLATPALTVTLAAELIRGVLITLSVLPLILTIGSGQRRLAVQTGFILFTVGGLFPLTLQIGVLPLLLLVASAVEIFFQNFSTGVVIARILRAKTLNSSLA